MTRRFLLSLWLLLCGLSAARAAQDLYNPLAVGLRWDVDIEWTTPAGKTEHGSAVRLITDSQKLGEYTYFVVVTTFTGLPDMKEVTMLRRKSPRAIYAINMLDKEKREFMEAALPLEVGQSWKTVIGTMVIISSVDARESVTAGGKTYENCVKISYVSDDGNVSGYYYQAPDVGNVKEVSKRGDATYTFTLKTFSGLK